MRKVVQRGCFWPHSQTVKGGETIPMSFLLLASFCRPSIIDLGPLLNLGLLQGALCTPDISWLLDTLPPMSKSPLNLPPPRHESELLSEAPMPGLCASP